MGIIFNKNGIDEENLENCIKKINTTFNLWNSVKLNMMERITVLKTFALSKLWYQANFVVLNESVIKKIETMAYKFIWNSCELIKRDTLLLDYSEGGLKMISIRAKLKTISLRNFMYIKFCINRPQYQLSVYWLKFYLRDYIKNFNIFPGGLDQNRPIFFKEMIKNIIEFKNLYSNWAKSENEKRQKIIENLNKVSNKKKVFKEIEPNFLENFKRLTSKFIYEKFIIGYKNCTNLLPNLRSTDQKLVFNSLHQNNRLSNLVVFNYKLLFKALPTNKKFNNRYEKKCYLCNKVTDESISHLFVECDLAKKCYDFVKNKFLLDKNIRLSLNLVQYKLNINKNDYAMISTFAYSIWHIRNKIKHSNGSHNVMSLFERVFNKWSISITGI